MRKGSRDRAEERRREEKKFTWIYRMDRIRIEEGESYPQISQIGDDYLRGYLRGGGEVRVVDYVSVINGFKIYDINLLLSAACDW